MRSDTDATAPGSSDDRSTKARIRDAAIDCIAAEGLAATTVRKVAETADVSPALVMHHFGSMEGLRTACDEFVVTAIRERKEKVIAEGPGLDILGAMRDADYGNLSAYVARVLMDDSEAVNRLVDEIVGDAVEYTEQGVRNGMFRASEIGHDRAALIAIWALGGLALHHHMKRILGVDLTDHDVAENPEFIRYVRPAMEIVGRGMFTDELNRQIDNTFNEEESHDD